jgi:ubiquinone/menaquinone biosynthesis C-methylase UbiE
MDSTAVYNKHYLRKQQAGLPGWFGASEIADLVASLRSRLERLGEIGQKVLEVGCGAGDQAMALSQMGFHVSGVDISAAAIDWANQKADAIGLRIAFFQADAREPFQFQDSQFDWVLDGCCWHFICDRRKDFLNNVFRVLRPEGMFLVQSNCGEPESVSGLEFDAVNRVQVTDGIPVTYFGEPESLLAELSDAGFQILHSEIIPAIPGKACARLIANAQRPE